MPPAVCASCGSQTATKTCKGCLQTKYCNTECQRADWTRHIFVCNPRRKVTTAHLLALNVLEHQFPHDNQVCQDWGIEKVAAVISTEAAHALFELYIELIESIGVKPAVLHTWRVGGHLIDGIRATYDRLPAEIRNQSPSYAWFLKYHHVLENTSVSTEDANRSIDRIYRRLYVQLGLPSTASPETIVDYVKGLSPAMGSCFRFYAFITDGAYPPAITDLYLKFGFGVCRNGAREHAELYRSYRDLATVASFEEFYTAYNAGRLFDLFWRKNVAVRLDRIRHEPLRDVLECMPHTKNLKTVWSLEHSLAAVQDDVPGEPTAAPMSTAARIDYGFVNCRGNKEHEEKLSGLYNGFFSCGHADPLRLHKAAIEGRIYVFLRSDMKMNIARQDRALYKRLLTRA